MHPQMGQREHYDVFRVLGEENAKDASVVSGIVDFLNDLPGFDSISDPLRPQQRHRLWRQFNFERQRSLERRNELAGFLRLVEHDCPQTSPSAIPLADW